MNQTNISNLEIPRFKDILSAHNRIKSYLKPTPLHYYPLLSDFLGTKTWVKHENHQPVGAFKVRGGINLLSKLDDNIRSKGVIAASTGI